MVEEQRRNNTAFDGDAEDPGIMVIVDIQSKKHKLFLKVNWEDTDDTPYAVDEF